LGTHDIVTRVPVAIVMEYIDEFRKLP